MRPVGGKLKFTVMNWTGILTTAVGVYGLVLVLMFLFQRNMMYYPPREAPNISRYAATGIQPVTVEGDDGVAVTHWYRPPLRDDLPVVVLFHGNAGHIGDRVPKYGAFLDAGLGLLLAEYRGFGGNPGRPTEQGLTDDARAVMAYLESQGIEPSRIVLYGESLGTGLAVKLAAEWPVAALVLEAPPGSVADVAQAHYWYLPAKWLVLDRWDVFPEIKRVTAPLLVIHGEDDRTVPQKFGRRLYEAAPGPKEALFPSGAGHVDLWDVPEVPQRVLDFVARHAPAPAD